MTDPPRPTATRVRQLAVPPPRRPAARPTHRAVHERLLLPLDSCRLGRRQCILPVDPDKLLRSTSPGLTGPERAQDDVRVQLGQLARLHRVASVQSVVVERHVHELVEPGRERVHVGRLGAADRVDSGCGGGAERVQDRLAADFAGCAEDDDWRWRTGGIINGCGRWQGEAVGAHLCCS